MCRAVWIVLLSLLAFQTRAAQGENAWLVMSQFDWSQLPQELSVVFWLTGFGFIPLVLIAMTSFTRIVIVLSMLRHALGLQQTPPNVVIITISLFLTLYTMGPTLNQIDDNVLARLHQGEITNIEAVEFSSEYIKEFMATQTRDEDVAAVFSSANQPIPDDISSASMMQLIPAFLFSELTTAFQIAFVIFIPFLLIDLIVASVLMALGMIMLPPISVALPIKVMLFVLVDGWSLLGSSLISSFS